MSGKRRLGRAVPYRYREGRAYSIDEENLVAAFAAGQ